MRRGGTRGGSREGTREETRGGTKERAKNGHPLVYLKYNIIYLYNLIIVIIVIMEMN